MFDCVLPTRSGRTGQAFTADGPINLRNARFAEDDAPIEPGCPCPACQQFSRAYVHHLVQSGEILGAMLMTQHNLWFYQRLMEDCGRRSPRRRLDVFATDFETRYRREGVTSSPRSSTGSSASGHSTRRPCPRRPGTSRARARSFCSALAPVLGEPRACGALRACGSPRAGAASSRDVAPCLLARFFALARLFALARFPRVLAARARPLLGHLRLDVGGADAGDLDPGQLLDPVDEFGVRTGGERDRDALQRRRGRCGRCGGCSRRAATARRN